MYNAPSAGETTREVKKLLKVHFPETKFSVVTWGPSGTKRFEWTDGPSQESVKNFLNGVLPKGKFFVLRHISDNGWKWIRENKVECEVGKGFSITIDDGRELWAHHPSGLKGYAVVAVTAPNLEEN